MKLIKSPLNALLNQAGVPTLANGGKPPTKQPTPQPAPQKTNVYSGLSATQKQAVQAMVGGLNVTGYKGGSKYSTNPLGYQLTGGNYIESYRHDPKGKFGGKDNLETQPTKLGSDQLTAYAKALRDSKLYGGKTLTTEQLATLASVEGRPDYGYNDLDINDKRAVKLAENLIALGHNPDAAGFAAAVDNKMRTAERLGIPFPVAWNGTGKSVAGATGRDYNARYNAAYDAGIYEHPKNAQLYEAVAMGFMPDEEKAKMPEVDVMGNVTGMKKGGSVAKQKAFLKFHKK